MRVDTTSGLHGQLIAFAQSEPQLDLEGVYGWAIIRRDSYPFEERPFSVHFLYSDEFGTYAEMGSYDLTIEQARARFQEKAWS